jgi:[acyl-carrier-protein] S-malonyltransferase
VVGHSVGEFAALAAADAMTLEEAIELVRERGLAMAEAARERPGSMAAVLGLDDEVVENLCRKILGVWPANYNCPGQIVVSGEDGAVEELSAEAQSLGARRAIKLKVSGAFHSPLVASAAKRLKPAIERVPFRETSAPFMSTVTAKVEPAQRLGGLLVDQLTAPVRFTQAARGLMGDGVKTFVEVGPGNVLSGLVKRIDKSVKTVSVNSVAALHQLEESLSKSA